jgi:hypothetical protein
VQVTELEAYVETAIQALGAAFNYNVPDIGLDTTMEEYEKIKEVVDARTKLLYRIEKAATALIPKMPKFDFWHERWFIETTAFSKDCYSFKFKDPGFYVEAYPPDGKPPITSQGFDTVAKSLDSIRMEIETIESKLIQTPVQRSHLGTLGRLVARFNNKAARDWEINSYLHDKDLANCLTLCRAGLLKRDILDRHSISYSWDKEWAQTYALPEVYEKAMQILGDKDPNG